jgi:hypothetical protein
MSPSIIWVGWLALFLIYEVYGAIARPKGDTLSENVWSWFGVRKGGHVVRRAFLALFMLTLSSHFVFGWPGALGVILTAAPVFVFITFGVVKDLGRE